MKIPVLAFLVAALFSGCATNNFSKFYVDKTVGASPSLLNKRLQPYSGVTQVYSSNNLQRDAVELARRNYFILGESAFEAGGQNTNDQLMEQAKLVGADAVLYATKYQGSEQTYVPLIQYHPGQSSTTYSSGTANASVYGSNGVSAYGTGNSSGYSTTTSPGTFSSEAIPVTVQRYAYDAVYWRMGRPRIFGTNVANLSDETRIALKRNTGAVVVLVINDSPAFHANVLVGDIIIRIDDTPIDSEQDVTTKMPAFAGKDCVLTVLRDGKETKIPIKLNPASP